jgi:glycosyltransferase involved in cell wall biosynthesis
VYPAWPYRFHFSRREQVAEFRKGIRSPPRVPWFDLRAELRRVPLVRTAFLPEADAVVATSWPTAHDVAGLHPSRGRKVHLVMHHEAGTGPEARIRAVYRLPLRRVTISRGVQTELEQAFGCEVAAVVPCSVDPHVFHPEGVRDERAVLMLLHPDPRKGAADGLAALTAVRERVPDVRVTLCATVRPGHWPPWANFVFHPSDDTLRRLYATSALFLYPSRYEGFGLPPLEAMACGCPVVTTAVGAVEEFARHGHDAMVVPPGDVAGLARVVLAVLADPALRRRLADNGLRAARRYTPGRAVVALEAALDVGPR